MASDDERGDAAHDGSRERGAGELHVAGLDDVVGSLRVERRRHGDRADHEAAWSGHVRLREAVQREAVGRPGCRDVVVGRHGLAGVARADGDDEGVVTGCVRDAARAGRAAVVAGCRNHHDVVEPQSLDCLVERVVHEAVGDRRMQGEVRDADPVLRLVRENPVRGGDDVARPRHPLVVHHVERDDLRPRSCAGMAGKVARGDSGHERSVAAPVAR